MTNENNNRPIPPIPGGGSWTFDYNAWEWVSNDPAPQPDAAPAVVEQAPTEHIGEE
jgi:hypothetical protein